MNVEAVLHGGGRIVAPQLIDQALTRDRMPCLDDQVREQGSWLRTAEHQRAFLVAHLDEPKNTELHAILSTPKPRQL